MGDLTRNFSAWEFTCRHCGQAGIKFETVEALQILRDRIGAPIHISSGYRCPNHPLSLLRPNSRHPTGEAADIVVTGAAPQAVADNAVLCKEFGGVGVDEHRGYVHVDTRPRRPFLWAYDENGKVVTV